MVSRNVLVRTKLGEEEPEGSGATRDSRVHHLDEGYLIDFLTDRPIRDTPKERVRQRIVRVLFHEYQFAPEDMQLDFPVKVRTEKGQRTKRIDIAIFAPGSEHTEGNLRRVVRTSSSCAPTTR
jgi:type I restriction enzyme M protein